MTQGTPSELLSLEDRLLVALASRGNQRIGQAISNALDRCGVDDHGEVQHDCAFGVSDEKLVSAVEAWVAEHQE